jgi:hypothetical protein
MRLATFIEKRLGCAAADSNGNADGQVAIFGQWHAKDSRNPTLPAPEFVGNPAVYLQFGQRIALAWILLNGEATSVLKQTTRSSSTPYHDSEPRPRCGLVAGLDSSKGGDHEHSNDQ